MTSLIDSGLKAFLEGGVSLFAATSDANNAPGITRAGGCRIDDDGRVTLFVATEQAGDCLDDVRATGRIAVIAVLPHTWECYQIKGNAARVLELNDLDRARVADCRRRLFASFERTGVPGSQAAGLLPADPHAYVGIEFAPTEIHCNTPAERALRDVAP